LHSLIFPTEPMLLYLNEMWHFNAARYFELHQYSYVVLTKNFLDLSCFKLFWPHCQAIKFWTGSFWHLVPLSGHGFKSVVSEHFAVSCSLSGIIYKYIVIMLCFKQSYPLILARVCSQSPGIPTIKQLRYVVSRAVKQVIPHSYHKKSKYSYWISSVLKHCINKQSPYFRLW
jgi:hypothetical protein